jgi:uncharacterized protein (TIGR00251 family)
MILKKQLKTGEILEVIVVCNSKFQEITKISESKYKIKLKSQPIKGKANKELKSYFKSFGYTVDILKGRKTNHKLLKIL